MPANREWSDDTGSLRRFGTALARDERFMLDDLAAGRLVDKLIRQAAVAPVEGALISRWRGRVGTFARFVQLYRRHVHRLALQESDEPWGEAPARRDGAAVADAMRLLPLELREVVLLVALGGFSHAEAAQALDISPGRLLDRLVRARERLAADMGAALDPAGELSWRGAPHLRVIK